jgi:hypothetical protein
MQLYSYTTKISFCPPKQFPTALTFEWDCPNERSGLIDLNQSPDPARLKPGSLCCYKYWLFLSSSSSSSSIHAIYPPPLSPPRALPPNLPEIRSGRRPRFGFGIRILSRQSKKPHIGIAGELVFPPLTPFRVSSSCTGF